MLLPFPLEYLVFGMLGIIILLLFVVISQAKNISKVNRKYNKLMRGMNDNNVEEILMKYINHVDEFGKRLHASELEIEKIHEIVGARAGRFGIKRYNAYDESGNDLSFSLSQINDQGNGFVLTGIYGRHEQRIYAKPVINGASQYTLTDEEKEVIAKALEQNLKKT
ncbi:hypothetical protein BHU72_12845 [Desulfuribacillus stibiiarsenatis]|uniref:DUF4446 domain-containing protein n=1 Tax=Desulfuribacillus stibiiarsenatis TaxID=1390249 RepID=A0A1E5L8P4_9FIRM|nr:DUF4446 family protein [Desulfuribacillus stibiiarsenatis]OEH86496.1 hypothetical protein BHU72_12845 [Desulfuribacillus stibiiarsenatis]